MRPKPLISPSFLIAQVFALVFFFAVTSLAGPFSTEPTEVPRDPLKPSDALTPRPGVVVEPDATLTERRPGPLSHKRLFEKEGKMWGHLDNQWVASLSLDLRLQEITDRHFKRSHAALGALVMMEVETGRVIGLSEYINADHPVTRRLELKEDVHLGLRALAPSAGVFRLVTSAALIEAGVNPRERPCYTKVHSSEITAHHIENRNPGPCASMSEAFIETDLGYFTFLSHKHLKSERLKRAALRLGFDRHLPYFGMPYELSKAHIPSPDISRARAALGLQGSRLSALHAAMIAATIAKGGALVRPQVVDFIESERGERRDTPDLGHLKNSGLRDDAARHLRQVLRDAMQDAEVSKVFQSWPAALSGYKVAGSASVRTYQKPNFMRYTWFVGMAPADRPRWAFAVMVLNNEQWYVRAFDVAHRVLRDYFSLLAP